MCWDYPRVLLVNFSLNLNPGINLQRREETHTGRVSFYIIGVRTGESIFIFFFVFLFELL